MSVLSAILLANISLALLAAIILWQGTRHASQLAAVREQFLQLSSTDPVTNLPNRATLHDRLSAALSVDGPEPALMVMGSEEHTSELQSRLHLVCRLLLEKKKSCSSSARTAPRAHSYVT